jgi:hypothetical protein
MASLIPSRRGQMLSCWWKSNSAHSFLEFWNFGICEKRVSLKTKKTKKNKKNKKTKKQNKTKKTKKNKKK